MGSTAVLALLVPMAGFSPAHAGGGGGGGGTTPSTQTGTITIVKGGDRTALNDRSGLAGRVTGLAGASFDVYRVGSSSALSGGTKVGSCTTAADGTCRVQVQLGTSSQYFYATETSPPDGWSVATTWGGDDAPWRYNTGPMRAGGNVAVTLPGTGRTWPNVRDNNTALTQCGLNIALVLDNSTSIDDGELTTFRNAAKGVVDALANTPSRVSLSRFATRAQDVLPLTSVADAAGAETVKRAIDGVDGSGNTNWDEALFGQVDGELDVVMLITDGDPTAYGDGSNLSATTRLRDIEEAIHSANAVKKAGSQVVAVGIDITGAASVKRLNLVSSPDSTYTASWDGLGATLKDIAAGQCEGQVTIQKQVRDAQGNTLVNSPESNGWEFDGTTSAGTLGDFAPTAAVNGINGSTSATLGVPSGARPVLTLKETLKPGYRFHSATCQVDGRDVTVTNDTAAATFSFEAKGNVPVSCLVTNKKLPSYADLTVTKTATPSYDRTYDWTIDKGVDHAWEEVPDGGKARFSYTVDVTPSAPRDSGFAVKGAITLTNPNDVTVRGVDIADQLNGATCSVSGGSTGRTVPAKGRLEVTYTCLDAAGSATAKGTNQVTVTWDKDAVPGTTGSAVASADYDYANAAVTVSNETAVVTDTHLDLDGTGADGVTVNAADGPRTFRYSLEFDSPAGKCTTYDNVATLTASGRRTQPSGDKVSDKAKVTVCTEAAPTIGVDGQGDLERAYAWGIDKVADATRRTVDRETGLATFTYTVEVEAGDETVSGHRLGGTVRLSNPNTYAEGALEATVDLATDLGAGTTCAVTGDATVTLAPGASAELPYECAFTAAPAESGTVTATVGWDPAGTATEATRQASTPVTFTTRREVDKVVDVVDDKTVPGHREVLETGLVWEQGLTRTYTYSLDLAGPDVPDSCREYTNTAVVDLTEGTDPSDDATVEACKPGVRPGEETGKATGKVKTSCQGTVRATLRNRTTKAVSYTLRIGKKVATVRVPARTVRTVERKGAPKAKVVLKVGAKVLDRARVPNRCKPPHGLPDTGMFTFSSVRLAARVGGWLS
ncbi:MAG: VWA domain-containing protein [Nocardioides sp.]|uniref:VWA domain-containing protein n=1 Tax=Nocardioides sp. TaxID=35761 RepID=UPI003F0C4C34